jgi:pimeloyl-ACP methyl ester carboxylesterase
MVAAAQRLIAERKPRAVIWVGHSGGGTVAMLIASRVAQTHAVVTIGGNLDVVAWAKYAGANLSGSLSPANAPALPGNIRQYHYAGGQDLIVPPSITAAGLSGAAGSLNIISGFDHTCCWATVWPAILALVDADASPH